MNTLSRKSTEVILQGGLGNQLFGWAVGLTLQSKLKSDLALNVSQLNHRAFGIPNSLLHGVSISYVHPTYALSKSVYLKKLYRTLFQKGNYFERTFDYEDRFTQINTPKRLFGYFQSYRYFEDVEPIIMSRLESFQEFSQQYRDLLKRMPTNFVSLHIRRGDYLNNPNYHRLLDMEYYSAALAKVRLTHAESPVVVFSDDKEFAIKLFPSQNVVSSEDLSDPFETMILMSKGVALIGGNSSFSLWAGYLMNHQMKITVFPKQWFAPGINSRDQLMPTQMHRI